MTRWQEVRFWLMVLLLACIPAVVVVGWMEVALRPNS